MGTMKVRGIRGATTATANTKEAIYEATGEMLQKLVESNGIDPDDIAAATFSTTRDLNAAFPAFIARKKFVWHDVALMCGHEMDVPGSEPRCIRVLILVNTEKSPQEMNNVFLRGAANLKSRGMEEV